CLDFYDGKYEQFKVPEQIIHEKEKFFKRIDNREHLVEGIGDKGVKAEVSKEWLDIEEKYFPRRPIIASRRINIEPLFIPKINLTDTDSIAVFIKMRRVLEILTEAHLDKLGHTYATRNVLADRMNLLRNEFPSHIREAMYDIKNTANGHAHKRLRNLKFSRNVTYTPEQMLEKFEKVMHYYITKIGI
ncbi:MAG: hypothetical protein LRY73_07200, partial [Bacillus sp. (in: Bacteria)]|nr:hypothetical protein [Bacillus sp. (in: firmicutes)]